MVEIWDEGEGVIEIFEGWVICNQELSCDGIFSESFTKVSKKAKIYEKEEHSTSFTGLGAFRGGFVVGVCLDWRVVSWNL